MKYNEYDNVVLRVKVSDLDNIGLPVEQLLRDYFECSNEFCSVGVDLIGVVDKGSKKEVEDE